MSSEKLATKTRSSKKANKLSSSRVEMHGVSKSYGEDWDAEEVIKDISVDFPAGELTVIVCLLYTSPSPRDLSTSRMPSSA